MITKFLKKQSSAGIVLVLATMLLFIANLSYSDGSLSGYSRIGILLASLVSGIIGILYTKV